MNKYVLCGDRNSNLNSNRFYVHQSLAYCKKTSYVGEFCYFVFWLQEELL